MLLYRLAPGGDWAAGPDEASLRWLAADPFATPKSAWEFARERGVDALLPLAPTAPRMIVGIGRNYREHATELGHPMPAEPLLFLKAISSLSHPGEPIVLPPESDEVHFEGELALVIGASTRRADPAAAAAAIFGYTAACDVTARDLQNRDRTFARAKGFDTFCPLGPAIRLGLPGPEVTVTTRVNGTQRQHAAVADMAWGPAELVAFVSRYLSLAPGDVLLTGTPAGVGPLRPGDLVEVEVSGAGVLRSPVEAFRR